MSELENKSLYHATRLHGGVIYCGGLFLLDRVKATANLIKEYSKLAPMEKEVAVCASLLRKTFEKEYIAEPSSPLTMEQIAQIGGQKVLSVIKELSTEPRDENQMTEEYVQKIVNWAKRISPVAQEVVLAEKIITFQILKDKVNSQKSISFYIEYFQNQMNTLDALKDANTKLYDMAIKTKKEVLNKLSYFQKVSSDLSRE